MKKLLVYALAFILVVHFLRRMQEEGQGSSPAAPGQGTAPGREGRGARRPRSPS